jgi:type I restriction enzyme, S subunit
MGSKTETAGGWTRKQLDEIGTIFSGSTPSTSNRSFWDGEIVWVTPNDLSKLRTPYLCNSGKLITEKGLKNCSAQLLPPGSLVMSSRAPIGYVALPTIPFCTNQGCKTIKLKNGIHPEFAYYNVLFNINKIKSLGEGTTFAEISKAALSTVELDFPRSLPEQTKIAEILSTVDRAIEQTEALIAKHQRIKTGLMQDLLTCGIDEHGNLRSEQTHQFKDSPLGRIPVEWDSRELGTVAFVTKLAGFEFTNYFDYRIGGDIIALRALNIKNERLDLTDIQRMPKAISEKLPRSKIFANDILITYIGAYIGDVLRIEENDKYHLAPNIAKIVAGKLLVPQFLEEILRSSVVQRQVKNLTAVTATPSLTMTQIRKLLVTVPKDKNEQGRVAKRIRGLNNVLNSIEAESKKLRSLKTALMQDLLTGKKRVPSLSEKEVSTA